MAETSMEEGVVEVQEHLAPCHICGRTFLPEPLKKHERICERNVTRKRRIFDSQKQRVEGTDLAVFHQKSYLKKNSGSSCGSDQQDAKPPPPRSKWKEKHLELVKIIREARGATIPPSEMPVTDKRTAASTTTSNSNEKCPTCDRAFGPKAYDRHVEWCREHKSRIQRSPANVLMAKERLEARTKYRVPPLNKSKRQMIKEKYAVKKDSPHQSNLKSASSNNFDTSPRSKAKDERQNELTRKTTAAGRNVARGDSVRENKPAPRKTEPKKGSVEDLIKSSKSKPSTMRGSGKVNGVAVNSGVLGMSVTQITADGGVAKSPGRLTTWVEEQRKRHPVEDSPCCELKKKLDQSERSLRSHATTSNRLPVPMSLSNVCLSSMEDINLSISYTSKDDSLGRHKSQEIASGRSSKFKVFGGSKYVEQVICEKNLRKKNDDYKHEDKLKIDVDNDRFYINTFRTNDSSCASERDDSQSVKTVVDIGIIDTKNDHNKGSLLANAETESINGKQSEDLSASSDYSLKKQIKNLKTFKNRNSMKTKLTKDDRIYANLPKSIVEELKNDDRVNLDKDNQISVKNYKSKIKKKTISNNLDIKETSSEENKTLQIEYQSIDKTDSVKIKLTDVNSEDSVVDIKTSSRVASPISQITFGNFDYLSLSKDENASEDFGDLGNMNSDISFHHYEHESDPTSPKFENTFKYTSLKSSDEILAFSKNLVEFVETNCSQLPIPSSESNHLLTDSTDTFISEDTCESNSITQNVDEVQLKDSFDKMDSKCFQKQEYEKNVYHLKMDEDSSTEALGNLQKWKENFWKKPSNSLRVPIKWEEDASEITCYLRKRTFGSKNKRSVYHCFKHRTVRGNVSKTSTKTRNLKHLRERFKKSSSTDSKSNAKEDNFNSQLLHPRSSKSFMVSIASSDQITSEKEIKIIDYENQSESSKLYIPSDYHFSTNKNVSEKPIKTSSNKTVDSKECLNFDSSDPSIFDTKSYNYDSGFGSVDEQSKSTTMVKNLLKDYTQSPPLSALPPYVSQQFHCSVLKINPKSYQKPVEETQLVEKSPHILTNVKLDEHVQEIDNYRKILRPKFKRKLEDDVSSSSSKTDIELWQSLESKNMLKEVSTNSKRETNCEHSNEEEMSFTVKNTNSQLLPSKIVNEIINIATGEDLNKKNRIIKTEGNFLFKTTNDITEEIIQNFATSDSNTNEMDINKDLQNESKYVAKGFSALASKFAAEQRVDLEIKNNPEQIASTTNIEISSQKVSISHSNSEKSLRTSKIPVLERSIVPRKVKEKNRHIEKYFENENHGNAPACGEHNLRASSDPFLSGHEPLTIIRSSSESSIQAFMSNNRCALTDLKKKCKINHKIKMFVLENKSQIVEEIDIPEQKIMYQERRYGTVLEYFETIFSSANKKKETEIDEEYVICDSQKQTNVTNTNECANSSPKVSLECLKFVPPSTDDTKHFKKSNPLNVFLQSLENTSPIQSKPCSNEDFKKSESSGSIITLSNASSWNTVDSTKELKNEEMEAVKVFKEAEASFDELESLDGDSGDVWVNALSSARLKESVRKCCSDVGVLKTFNLYTNKGLEGVNRTKEPENKKPEEDTEFPVTSGNNSVDQMCSLTHSQIIRIAADDFLASYVPKKQPSPTSSQEVIPKKRQKMSFKKGITSMAKKIVGCFCKKDKDKRNILGKCKSQCSVKNKKRRNTKKTIAHLAESSEYGLQVSQSYADFQVPAQINTKFSNETTHTGIKKMENTTEDGSNKINQACLLCFFNVTGGDLCVHDEKTIISSPKRLDEDDKGQTDTKNESILITNDNIGCKDDFHLPTINVKTTRKSAVKPKESITVLLPPIDNKNQDFQRSSRKEKAGCNNSCAELGYDPFLSAKRQLEELLEGDDFTPLTPDKLSLTTTNNRPHTTNAITKTILPNSPPPIMVSKQYKSDEKLIKENGKRSSVIDPPFLFQDKLSQLNEEFDLIENFIKENFPENKEKEKIDSFFLHQQKNFNDDKYIINNIINKCNFGDDICNIDPKLINENDNLIIPSNFAFDSSPEGDPTFTFEDVRNRNNNNTDYFSVQYDKKIESVLEPKLATRNTKTNILPALEKQTVTNKIVKSSPSIKADKNPSKITRLPQKTIKQSISINSYATPPIVSSVKKKNNPPSPYLKRSLSLLEPAIKSRSQKTKEQIHPKQDRRSPERKSPGRQQIISNKEVKSHEEEPFKISTFKATADDLFTVDVELYEEYKKFEETYLKDKQQKMQQNSDVNTGKEDVQLSQKNSDDSAYSSLNRKPSKIRARSTKLTPLDCQKVNTESTSSSGTDTSSTSPSHPHPISSVQHQQKVPKFCHECGCKYPIDSAKFCVNCGVKKLLL